MFGAIIGLGFSDSLPVASPALLMASLRYGRMALLMRNFSCSFFEFLEWKREWVLLN